MVKKLMVLLFCCAAVTMSGCNEASESKPQEITAIDTSTAEAQFRSAAPEIRSVFETAANAIKSGKHEEAETSLRTLLSNARLSPAQEQAARELMIQLQQPR